MITIAYIALGFVVAQIASWCVDNWVPLRDILTGKAFRWELDREED